jgi:hypothetical protein
MDIVLTLKPKAWFEQNCFKDEDGDYWFCESDRDIWEKADHGSRQDSVKRSFIGYWHLSSGKMPFIDGDSLRDLRKYQWAIEETPDTHPQYFV